MKVLKSARISRTVSYGKFSQNESLLPLSINSALVEEYPGALDAPRSTAEARSNITPMDFSLNSKIVKNIYLNAGIRTYNFDNKTEELDIFGYFRFNKGWEFVPSTNEPFGFTRSTYFGDLSFNLIKNTSLKIGYSFYRIERKAGEEDEGKSDEGTLKASLDTNVTDWLMIRVSYLNAKRDWSLEGEKDIYAPGFNFKRYHEADRDRNGTSVLIDLSPIKNLDVAVSYMMGKDRYPKSDYGLKKDDFSVYGLDLSYALTATTSVYGFYSHEIYDGDQAPRQSGATFSTDPRNDWTAGLKDAVDSAGGGLNTFLVKDKVNFNLSYTYSKAAGISNFFSPPGGTLNIAVNFDKKIDATKFPILKANLGWKLKKDLSVVLGYWYEQYSLEDITRGDWKFNEIQANYIRYLAMYLEALEPGFKYHVGLLKFIWSF